MRRILVEHARKANRPKRGGGVEKLVLEDDAALAQPPTVEILALDQALDRLAEFDERKAKIVELYYFGGMTYDEGAAALGLSAATFTANCALPARGCRKKSTRSVDHRSGVRSPDPEKSL